MPAKTTTTTALTAGQQRTLERARETLAQDHDYDAFALSARVGSLGYHLEAVLALVAELAQDGPIP